MSTSPTLLSTLELLWINDYACLIFITATIYDYFLTLLREITYVWLRSWTWISALFLLIRYVGLSLAIIGGLYTTTFMPDSIKLCTTLSVVVFWQYVIFLTATDLVMIVRVYAMWNQSKRILGILLLVYVPQAIFSFIMAGIISNPNTFRFVAISQVFGFSSCNGSWPNQTLIIYAVSLRLALGIMLLILAITQTLKQSIQMYKVTKQWQPSQYIQQFMKDGIFYFAANTVVNITGMITPNTVLLLFISSFCSVILIPLVPRFIIGVRELYDSKLHGQGIDTGFGVFSQPISGGNIAISVISFAEVIPGQLTEGEADASEEFQSEASGDSIHQV